MSHNTLQIHINEIYFDRPTVPIMWGYVATLVRANVESNDYQMYLSPASFRVVRIDRPGQADLVHRYDGEGLMIASFPTADLKKVLVTAFFIRDLGKQRDAGALLADLFKGDGDAAELAAALEPLLAKLPRVGAVASMVLKLPRALGALISDLLMARKDAIKIYADGSLSVAGLDEDFTMQWGVGQGDKGFFKTTWDFCNTSNPNAVVTTLELPPALRERLEGRR